MDFKYMSNDNSMEEYPKMSSRSNKNLRGKKKRL